MNILIKLFCMILIFATTVIAEAKLTFDSPEYKATAEFGQKAVPFEFIFENTGDFPVEITNIRTSCGCTTSELEKRIYLPGEVGMIEGEYTVGERQGLQRQHVHIETDHPEQERLHLEVVVSIGGVLDIAPRLVYWRANEEPEPKSVKLSPAVNSGLRVEDVIVDSEDFTVELIDAEAPGAPLELMVIPAGTGAAARGLITISTAYQGGKKEDFTVHALVR